ncbi:MAG: Soluble lytic murein transglycosylase [Alphaproteobacteria bacterium MarineAlpha8_Bin1]|nr:MAG: Soluble lytic murein transglycosylase [Alphaproteobacteria bacterium MarineAlpha8_Bin1]
MFINILSIKFFFLIFINFTSLYSLDFPEPQARPIIKEFLYKDVFDQIKKQNWSMALALSQDYRKESLTSYVNWLNASRPGTNLNFQDLSSFYKKNSHWPKKKSILKNIESAISKNDSKSKVLEWFENNPPITAKGAIDHLEFLIKAGKVINKNQMVKEIWINRDLTYNQQRYFIKNYSRYWNQDDNWKRFNRLIYEGKNISARRTLNRIKGNLRKLGEARLGLSRRAGNVSTLINQVPQNLKNDPGLIYERLRWRRKAKLDTAVEFLNKPPAEIQNVRNWWINSRIVIRRLINKKRYTQAYNVLKKHNLPLDSQSGAEAEWLAGWVSLVHLKNSKNSQTHFENVFNNSTNQNVRSKAAFWIFKSYELENKDRVEAKKWLLESAKNKFTFYGQNASIKLNNFKFSQKKLNYKKPLKGNDLIEVIRIIQNSNQNIDKTTPFFLELLNLCESDEEKNYVLNLANSLEEKSIVTKLSRKIEKPSIKFSYPLIENYIPNKYKNSSSTMALIHAITHQESNFKVNAYSSAGARGLMQLMPFTAKKVARDLKIKYYKKALTRNPQYNIILGTTYINEMLRKFDNALPLALAAYNAGPSRVKIWLKRYGDPRKSQITFIDWIESIPISETRFYVKKVLSNLRIYQKKYGINFYEMS